MNRPIVPLACPLVVRACNAITSTSADARSPAVAPVWPVHTTASADTFGPALPSADTVSKPAGAAVLANASARKASGSAAAACAPRTITAADACAHPRSSRRSWRTTMNK